MNPSSEVWSLLLRGIANGLSADLPTLKQLVRLKLKMMQHPQVG
ncbi:hypothetical protein ACFYXF_33235 [Streptomyces sp. NPDC002680]